MKIEKELEAVKEKAKIDREQLEKSMKEKERIIKNNLIVKK
jgi:hypothetical protein